MNKNLTFNIRLACYFVVYCLLFTVSAQSSAGKIYKWTDSDGNVHYSATEPLQSESKSMGNTHSGVNPNAVIHPLDRACQNASKAQLLVGTWQLKDDKNIKLQFHAEPNNIEVKNRLTNIYYIHVDNNLYQAGGWSVKNDVLKLKINNIRHGQNRFKPIKKARIHKVSTKTLYILVNGTEALKFKRNLKSKNMPQCMKIYSDNNSTKNNEKEKTKTTTNNNTK